MSDVRFYQTLSQIEIAIGKEIDQSKYKEEELKERLANWERQEQYLRQINPVVTHFIELNSMALLAKEKGHSLAEKEIGKEVSKQKQKYDRYKLAKEIIHQYGDKKFWNQYQQHTELTLLAKIVWNDMIQQTKKRKSECSTNRSSLFSKEKV
ncbi:hypothetical protein [Bacillus methanolicus]|uniref:hypothetical protein n=1 Tax=Bacillus methanolicus TaxID=1471 RepID=UPI002380C338|nr:hypothetical protein [Bacillus methanolicus]